MAILQESGGGNQNLYPNYGVSKEIAQAIDIILSDPKKWAYSEKMLMESISMVSIESETTLQFAALI